VYEATERALLLRLLWVTALCGSPGWYLGVLKLPNRLMVVECMGWPRGSDAYQALDLRATCVHRARVNGGAASDEID
jgi:hypothetical protein